MVWAPGYGGASVPDDETGIRCGVVRSTMKSNTLLSKAGVGEVRYIAIQYIIAAKGLPPLSTWPVCLPRQM